MTDDPRMPMEVKLGGIVEQERWTRQQALKDQAIMPNKEPREPRVDDGIRYASDHWAGTPTPESVKKPAPIRKPVDSDNLPRPLEKSYHVHLSRLGEHLITDGSLPDLIKRPVPDEARAACARAWILSKTRPTAARLDQLARDANVDPQIDIQADLFEVWLWSALKIAGRRERLFELTERRKKAEAAVEDAKAATVQVSENYGRLNSEDLAFRTLESADAIRGREREVAGIVIEILEAERCTEARQHIEGTKLIRGIIATVQEVKLAEQKSD